MESKLLPLMDLDILAFRKHGHLAVRSNRRDGWFLLPGGFGYLINSIWCSPAKARSRVDRVIRLHFLLHPLRCTFNSSAEHPQEVSEFRIRRVRC